MIVQISDPSTYFRRRPIRIGEGAGLGHGLAALAGASRATLRDAAPCAPALLSGKAETVARHRQIEAFRRRRGAGRVDRRPPPFPVQVDGDFIGDYEAARVRASRPGRR